MTVFTKEIDTQLLSRMNDEGNVYYKMYNVIDDSIFANAFDPYNLKPKFYRFMEESGFDLNKKIIGYIPNLNEFLDLYGVVMNKDYVISTGYNSVGQLTMICVNKFIDSNIPFDEDGEFVCDDEPIFIIEHEESEGEFLTDGVELLSLDLDTIILFSEDE